MGKHNQQYSPFYSNRKNPCYDIRHQFTVVKCEKCGEYYEPCCSIEHVCKKYNSYPLDE